MDPVVGTCISELIEGAMHVYATDSPRLDN